MIFRSLKLTPKRLLVLTTLDDDVVAARRAKIVEILKGIWTGLYDSPMDIQISKVAADGSLKVKSSLIKQESNFSRFVDDFFNFGDGFENRNILLSSETKKLSLGLQWFDTNELGMSVTCPHGNVMKWPDTSLDCCNGWMDIHMNESGVTAQPVDHIIFGYSPGHGLTIGEYRISVQMLTQRNSEPSEYRMMINADDHFVHAYSGQIEGENSTQQWGSLFFGSDLSARSRKTRPFYCFLLTDENFNAEQDALIKSIEAEFLIPLVVIPVVEGQSFPALREKIGKSGKVVHPDLLGKFIKSNEWDCRAFDPSERCHWPDPQFVPPFLELPPLPPISAHLDIPDPDSG